jgi:hypothetical protein
MRATSSALAIVAGLFVASCPGEAGPPWRVVLSDLDEGLLSVWGTSASDVWAVGGDRGRGAGPLVLHFDGSRWQRLLTGQTGDLWWVHGFAGGPVFMGGEDGMILRFQNGSFERMTTPAGGAIVFGIWGTSPSDVWAVGGIGRSAGFVWHFDGSAWSPVPTPAGFEGRALFKVWGTASDDVWFCGIDGILMHWDGAQLSIVDSGTTRTLFTVHAIEGAAAAVGGVGSAVLVERGPDGIWHGVAPELAPQLFGVWLTPEGGQAVGVSGSVLRRSRGRWEIEETGLFLAETLHSVWIDPDGGVWAVGGQVLSEPLIRGVLIYRGRANVPTTIGP